MFNSMLSARAFAKKINKSHTWVCQKIKEGVFPVTSDNMLKESDCMAIYKSLTAVRQKRQATMAEQKVISDYRPPVIRIEDESELDLGEDASASAIQMKYAIAKANEKTAVAGLRSIELRLKKGEILERSEVEADAAGVASFLRNALLSLPARYSALVYGQSQRKIQEILEDAVTEILEGLQRSKFLAQ